MGEPAISYASRADTKPEAELNALISVYAFILDSRARKEGGPATALENARKESNRVSRNPSLPT